MAHLPFAQAANVGELLAILQKIPPDTPIIQSRDEEGNGFLPLMGVSICRYLPHEDIVLSIEEDAPSVRYQNATCLWPAHDWRHAQSISEMRKPDGVE